MKKEQTVSALRIELDDRQQAVQQREQDLKALAAHWEARVRGMQQEHHDALAERSSSHHARVAELESRMAGLQRQLDEASLLAQRAALQTDVDIEHALHRQHTALRQHIAELERTITGPCALRDASADMPQSVTCVLRRWRTRPSWATCGSARHSSRWRIWRPLQPSTPPPCARRCSKPRTSAH